MEPFCSTRMTFETPNIPNTKSLSVADLTSLVLRNETNARENPNYDGNLNQKLIINKNHKELIGRCSHEVPRKSYSLPHRYKPPLCLLSHRSKPQTVAPLSPSEFRQRFSLMHQWFSEFTDDQRNRVLSELLEHIGTSQLHLLSLAIGGRLHNGCPPNCEDPISWIPHSLSLHIFSLLDPVSLARASQVCKSWQHIISSEFLWRRLSLMEKWNLSPTSHSKQIQLCKREDGTVDWKKVFVERFRLRRNWLGAHYHIRTFEGHQEGVSCVQFDEHRIVSGSHDNTIKVWNMRTNSQWLVQTLVGHSGMVRCLHLTGNRIVSGATDKTIKVWDVEETSEWSSIACRVTMVGHLDTVRCLQVSDELVVSGSYDQTIKLWALTSGVCQMTLRGHTGAVLTVTFDDKVIISGAADKTIKIWNLEDGNNINTLIGHEDGVTTLTTDDTQIISGSLDCTIRIWCISTGQCLGVLDWMSSEGHTGVIRYLAADSWRIVSASDDKTIKVWDRRKGRRIKTLRSHTDGVTCLAFNDYVIVSGSYDKTVKLWDFTVC